MSKREQHRARYIDAWNAMDAGKLLASITDANPTGDVPTSAAARSQPLAVA